MGMFPTQPERNNRSLSEIVKGIGRIRFERFGGGSNIEKGHRACGMGDDVHSTVAHLIYGCEGLMLSDFMDETVIFFPGE